MAAVSIQLTICTCNNAPSLARTLDSIRVQRGVDDVAWSVLLVDNNSTDDTAVVAQQARLDLPITYVTESEQGIAFARRRAFSLATADWIAFVDDDCILDPDWLAAAHAFIDRHPDAGAIGGRVDVVFPDGASALARRNLDSYAAQDLGDVARDLSALPFIRLVGAGLLVRRDAVERSDWLQTFRLTGRAGRRLSAGDDTELVLAVRAAGFQVWYAPALRLRHEIPAHRTTTAHLCRLHAGFGEAGPYLQARAGSIRLDSTARRLRFLLRQCAGTAWYAGRWLVAAAFRRTTEPDRRLDLFRIWGRLRAAAALASTAPPHRPLPPAAAVAETRPDPAHTL